MAIRIKDSNNVEPRDFLLLPVGNTENGEDGNVSLEQMKNFTDADKAPVAFSGDYSDLTNTPNLDEYATLTTLNTSYYNRNQVNELISSIENVSFEIVDVLPEAGYSNIIYLVPQEISENNLYDEYIWLNDGKIFEKIGSTEVNLENYYNKTEIDDRIPIVYDSTITFTQGGVEKGSFKLNQSNSSTIDLTTAVAQIQPNWEQSDTTADDYIRNKPETRAFTITYDDESQETINFYIKDSNN